MWIVTWLLGCGPTETTPETPPMTYYQDAKPIIDAKCATCHQTGDVGPFPMTTADEVRAIAGISQLAIESGRMPPFLPSHDCNRYTTDFDLTDEERELLLAFFEQGAPAGDSSAAVPSSIPTSTFAADLTVGLPEPYTPVLEPDDYRCQLVDLGITEPTYVTGYQVLPDQRAIVHHTILFIASAEQVATYQGYDADEAGPGWTCFGGPNPESAAVDIDPSEFAELIRDPEALGSLVNRSRSLGSWVPGAQQGALPDGTGILLNPGDQLVVQMHYNTLSASPVADQSQIALTLANEVQYPATSLPLLDLAWPTGLALLGEPLDIPAGSADASAEVVVDRSGFLFRGALQTLGLDDTATVRVHAAGVHMHQLGVDGRIDVQHADGSETCAIHYPAYDFNWQGNHQLVDTISLGPDDSVRLRCRWDNTAENQPIVDGEPLPPRDVSWGEGTTDEMCLGSLYITE